MFVPSLSFLRYRILQVRFFGTETSLKGYKILVTRKFRIIVDSSVIYKGHKLEGMLALSPFGLRVV